MKITSIIFFTVFAILILKSCEKKSEKEATKTFSNVKPKDSTTSSGFKSNLRPGENLKLEKMYTDTVQFINFDMNGDDWYFNVKKNNDTIGLIYNNDDPQLTRGDQLQITWKMDSLRPAGDPEYLDYSEYLVSFKIIKSIKEYSVVINRIDSAKYFNVKNKLKPIKQNIEKITDFKVVKKLLRGVVEFDENPDFGEYPAIKKINFRNGKKLANDELNYTFFVAYYPQEDILLCEGGHSIDISFDLKNGKETQETGNPDLIYFSPNKIFRINGSYDGQECMGYFIQKKIGGEFRKIISFENEFKKQTSTMLCNIRDGFWVNEHTFFLEKFDFDYETGKFKFYTMKIIER